MGEVSHTSRRFSPEDRGIIIAVMVGVWWALFLLESIETRRHQHALEGLSGPDWDVRAEDHADQGWSPPWAPLAPAPYPRALRQARGVGRARALDLARYFHRSGVDAPADRLHGVGPVTARAASSVVASLQEAFAALNRSGRGEESVTNVTSSSRSRPVPRDPP